MVKRLLKFTWVFIQNIPLVFSYRRDLKMLDTMEETLKGILIKDLTSKWDISDYNKFSLSIYDKYEPFYKTYFEKRLSKIRHKVMIIKITKNKIDKLKKSGKQKFSINEKAVWERSFHKAYEIIMGY